MSDTPKVKVIVSPEETTEVVEVPTELESEVETWESGLLAISGLLQSVSSQVVQMESTQRSQTEMLTNLLAIQTEMTTRLTQQLSDQAATLTELSTRALLSQKPILAEETQVSVAEDAPVIPEQVQKEEKPARRRPRTL